MGEIVNGQIVPALGQWQGAALIVVAAAIALVLCWRRARH